MPTTIPSRDKLPVLLGRPTRYTGAALVGYVGSSDECSTTTVQAKLDERVSVLDFGAKGNGSDDDAAAIQLAFNVLQWGNGGHLHFPAGTYRCVSTVTIAGDNVTVTGDGPGATTIELPTNGAAANVRWVFTGNNVTVRNLKFSEIDSPTRTGVYGCLSFNTASGVTVDNVEVDGASSTGIHAIDSHYGRITNCYVHNTQADGIHLQRACSHWTISNCVVIDCGDDAIAAISHNWPTHDYVQQISVANCVVGAGNSLNDESAGISFAGVIGGTITGNAVYNTRGKGINVQSITDAGRTAVGGRISVTGNSIYNTGVAASSTNKSGMTIGNCKAVTVSGNTIFQTGSHGLLLVGSHVNIHIADNTIIDTGSTGMYIAPSEQTGDFLNLWDDALLDDGTTLAYVFGHMYTIRNNVIDRAGTTGIFLNATAARLIDKATIRDNVITRSNTTAAAVYGINLTYVDQAEVAGNVIKNPASALSGNYLISNCTNTYRSSDLELRTTFTWNPGNLVDGAGETSAAVTVTGAAFGDMVLVAAPYDLQGITCTGYVSAADTAQVRLQNETGGAIDLANGTWHVWVRKQL